MTNLSTLVPIEYKQIGESSLACVSAKQLHLFLEVGRDFSNWIKGRIKKYLFIENLDFTPILAKSKNGRPSIDYAITTDMAKELCMVENNEKGRLARRYFIDCERKLAKSNQAVLKMASDPIISMRMKQIEMDERLSIVEAKVTNKNEHYYSISGYARLKGIRVVKSEALKLGKQAGKLSRSESVKIDKVHDEKYGRVNSYHSDILETVFTNFLNPAQNA